MKRKFFNFGIYIPILIIGLIVSSCKKEPNPVDNLVGTWTVNNATYTAMVGNMTFAQYEADVVHLPPQIISTVTQALTQMVDKSISGTIMIKSDNTFTSTLGGNSDSGTWSLSPNNKTLDIISSTKSPMVFNIIDLSATKMDLSTLINYSADLNNDGTPEVINTNVTASLGR